MKKKCFFLAAMSVLTLPMLAQETYENTKLIDNDLNGTARYVGMGGAMDALGADLTTITLLVWDCIEVLLLRCQVVSYLNLVQRLLMAQVQVISA